jgi:hypothetical protein
MTARAVLKLRLCCVLNRWLLAVVICSTFDNTTFIQFFHQILQVYFPKLISFKLCKLLCKWSIEENCINKRLRIHESDINISQLMLIVVFPFMDIL